MSPPAKGSFWQSLLITWSDSLCTNHKHFHLLHCFWSVHLQAMQCFGSAWSLYPVYCYIHLTSYLLPQVSKVKCLHLLKAHSDNPFWSLEVIRYVPITNTFTCSIVFGLFICKQCNALDQREVHILSIAISILTNYLLSQVSKVKCLHLLKAPPLMTWLHSFWQSPLITWSDSLCTNHKHCSIVFGLFISNQKMYVLLFWEQLLAVGGVMALYSEYAKSVVHKFSPGKCSAHIHRPKPTHLLLVTIF